MDWTLISGVQRGLQNTAAAGSQVQGLSAVAGASRVALNIQTLLSAIESQGSKTQFAHDVRALVSEAARGLRTVYVVQPAASGVLRLDIGGQFLNVPAALRDAVLSTVAAQMRATAPAQTPGTPAGGQAAAAPTAPTPSMPQAQPPLLLTPTAIAWAQAHGAAQVVYGHTAGGVAKGRGTHTGLPLIDTQHILLDADSPDSMQTAAQLRSAVANSGLFFESHLAQWLAGTRSAEALRTELARIQTERLMRQPQEDAPVHLSPLAASGERVAAQLEVLQKSAFALHAQAWAGQPVTIALREETPPDGHGPGVLGHATERLVSATLRLDLPQFGPLEVHIRMVGQSVAILAAADPSTHEQLRDSFEALGTALEARGLNPAAIQVHTEPSFDSESQTEAAPS